MSVVNTERTGYLTVSVCLEQSYLEVNAFSDLMSVNITHNVWDVKSRKSIFVVCGAFWEID